MKPYERHKARILALQALYQQMFAGDAVEKIIAQFLSEKELKKTDIKYFQQLLEGVVRDSDSLDHIMLPYIDRPLQQLNSIELIVLRLAIFELKNSLDVPYRVVINEALELAKKFGAAEGHKYVNGVLDKVAKVLRKDEMKK